MVHTHIHVKYLLPHKDLKHMLNMGSSYQLQFPEGVDTRDLAFIFLRFTEDLLPDLLLPLWVDAEQEHRPGKEGRGGIYPRGEESLALPNDLLVAQPVGAPPTRLHHQPKKVLAVVVVCDACFHHLHDPASHQPVELPCSTVAASWQVPCEKIFQIIVSTKIKDTVA